jgi:hypothetical protein
MKRVLLAFPFMCFFIFITTGNLFSQIDVYNTGVLYIGSSIDTVYTGASFTNTSSAALTNNTVLNIKQNLTNSQAAMSSGAGTLYLNGSSTQFVSGTQVFKTNNLVTNNGNGITLNNNLSVSGTHTFMNGLLTSSATPNYLIYEAGSSYTGDNDASHVNGWVKKLGSANFTFPVGNTIYERSIALSSLGSSAEFAVKYNSGPTPNPNSLYGPLILVDTNEYWTINRISGTSAVVTLNWDNAKVPVPYVGLSNVRAASFDPPFWRSIGGTGIGDLLTTGTVTSNSTSIFNTDFTIASTSLVLPVKLISFTAENKNGIAAVQWQVANEQGIKFYQLQRSGNGVNFTAISSQTAINNAGGNVSYTYNDAGLTANKIYYRLMYTDISGKENYSGIVILSNSQDAGKNFYIIKNPVTEKIDFFASTAYKGKYIYLLSSTSGQVVQTGTVEITTAGIYSVPLRNILATGVYVLSLQNQQHTLQKTILKE